MFPILFSLPVWLVAALFGALLGGMLTSGSLKTAWAVGGTAVGAVLGLLLAFNQPWGAGWIPVRGYGIMILSGFLLGVWLAARRSRKIGVESRHCLDVGMYGVVIGLTGARLFHVWMNWADFDPFASGKFDHHPLVKILLIWEGGLVFYGTFFTVIPFTWLYCRAFKLPKLAFLDMAIPSLFAGLALGRIGCFLNGCCYGKTCDLAWAVRFPHGPEGELSPPFHWQASQGLVSEHAARTLPIHPTQIYASIAAALTCAFLYLYWPRRKYDGQILSLGLIMAGSTRFFEELLRTDEGAAYPQISAVLTIAQYLALFLVASGFACLLYFRSRAKRGSPLSKPAPRLD
jgi:phosphatidylglycerol:prolipoprotein diacylglycerol transferase